MCCFKEQVTAASWKFIEHVIYGFMQCNYTIAVLHVLTESSLISL